LTQSAITYRTIWRWHFYAGLFSIPFILWLSVTGSIYLFRPQIERLLDWRYDHLAIQGARATPAAEVEAALHAVPGTNFHYFELPRDRNSAAQVVVGRGKKEYRVYVNPATLHILKVGDEDRRPMEVLFYLHGELLLGDRGSNIIELAASWAVVLLITGIYLWWPRQTERLAGVLYVRLHRGSRIFWRDLHAVTGILISAYAFFILFTGLPWASFWGGQYLLTVRTFAASHLVHQAWSTGENSALQRREASDASAMAGMQMPSAPAARGALPRAGDFDPLNRLLPEAESFHLAPPVRIAPLDQAGGAWSVRSDSQDRPLRTTLYLDPASGAIVKREPFSQLPLVDRIVDTGVAMHEGQLFGLPNQLLGLATALGLITMCISAIVMWWRRRADGVLGAPLPIGKPRWSFTLVAAIVALAIYLPAMAVSLLVVLLTEKFVLSRIPSVNRWLGLSGAQTPRSPVPSAP